MSKLQNFSIHTQQLDDAEQINQRLIQGLNQYIDDESTKKSHHFFGRYENIYIDKEKLPELKTILHAVKGYAAEILHCDAKTLKAGLWFNVMNPGDKTTLHRHDDDDELLSAVYYVSVAENSGMLYLKKNQVKIQVTPQEGMFAFFSPAMPHEVSENLSQECRISLGINIGPA